MWKTLLGESSCWNPEEFSPRGFSWKSLERIFGETPRTSFERNHPRANFVTILEGF